MIKGYRGDARTPPKEFQNVIVLNRFGFLGFSVDEKVETHTHFVLILGWSLERNNLLKDKKQIGCPLHKMGTKVSKEQLCHYSQATVTYRTSALWKYFCS